MSEKGRRGRRPIAIHFVRGTLFTSIGAPPTRPTNLPTMFGYSKLNEGGKNLPALPSFHRHLKSASRNRSRIDRHLHHRPRHQGQRGSPGCLSNAEPFIKMAIKFFLTVAPIYKKFYTEGDKIYAQLPANVLTMIFGVALCFFGGTYVASIAAIEAFRQMGYAKTLEELMFVKGEQLQIVYGERGRRATSCSIRTATAFQMASR